MEIWQENSITDEKRTLMQIGQNAVNWKQSLPDTSPENTALLKTLTNGDFLELVQRLLTE